MISGGVNVSGSGYSTGSTGADKLVDSTVADSLD